MIWRPWYSARSCDGQISSLRLISERQFAVALLTNGSGGMLLNTEVSQWIYQQYLGISEAEPSFLSLTEEELAPYVGLYDSVLSRTEAQLSPEGLIIISQFKGGYPTRETPGGPPGNPRRIAFYSKDRVIILDPPWQGNGLTFIRKSDGSVNYLQALHLLRKVL